MKTRFGFATVFVLLLVSCSGPSEAPSDEQGEPERPRRQSLQSDKEPTEAGEQKARKGKRHITLEKVDNPLNGTPATTPDHDEAAYRIKKRSGEWLAANPANGYETTFRGSETVLHAEQNSWRLGMELEGVEWNNRPANVGAAQSVSKTKADRLEREYRFLTEYFVNRRAGLKHGFIVRDPPKTAINAGKLSFELHFESERLDIGSVSKDEVVFGGSEKDQLTLRYNQLKVLDAEGRQLTASFRRAGPKMIQITVQVPTRTAFPIHIDPTFSKVGQTFKSYEFKNVAVGDLNGDNLPDAVFGIEDPSEASDYHVEVWINDGVNNGTFSFETRFLKLGISNGPRDIELGKLDSDSHLDLFVAHNASLEDQIFLGNGDGTFTPHLPRLNDPFGHKESRDVELVDLEDDGNLDAVVGRDGHSTAIWTNDGTGTFSFKEALAGSRSHSIGVGKLDDDSTIDIFNPDTGEVWFGDGDATFTNSGQSLSTYSVNDVAIGDLDGDDDQDAITANNFGDRIVPWINDDSSPGHFTEQPKFGAFQVNAIEVMDINGDGALDVVTGAPTSDGLKVYTNNGEAEFSVEFAKSGIYIDDLALADVDGDSDPDILTVGDTAGGPRTDLWLVNRSPDISVNGGGQADPGDIVTLDASATADPDSPNSSLTYSWNQTAGPTAAPNSPGLASTDVTLPSVGTYTYEVTVTDPKGAKATKPVTVTSTRPPAQLPEPDMDFDSPVLVGQAVTLDGTKSSDPDDPYSSLSFQWEVNNQPNGASPSLQNPQTDRATFTPSTAGTYQIELTVEDPSGSSASVVDTLEVDAKPVARIDSPSSSPLGSKVTLDGTDTTDADTDISDLIFNWSISSKPANSSASLSDASAQAPTIQMDESGEYRFELNVEDPSGYTDSTTATIEVSEPPTAKIGKNQYAINVNEAVQLDGSGSSDPDGTLSLDWQVVSSPYSGNMTYSLSNSSSQTAQFSATRRGEYVVELTATDDTGLMDRTTASIDVNGAPDVILTKSTSVVNLGNTVGFDASETTDPDSSKAGFSYLWSIVSAPAGSQVDVQSNGATANLKPDASGIYKVRVRVSDDQGAAASEALQVRANAAPSAAISASKSLVQPDDTVVLESSQTTDDFDAMSALSFQWSVASSPSGANPSLSTNNSQTAVFRAGSSGTYAIQLTATDTDGATAETTTSVTVNEPPTVEIGQLPVINTGESYEIDSNRLSDPETQVSQLTLDWRVVDGPSSADLDTVLSNSNAESPTFQTDVHGDYTIAVTVTDGDGASRTARSTLTVNAVPTADAGDDITVVVGEKFTLDASDTVDPDSRLSPEEYVWRLRGGSKELIASKQVTSFDEPGAYTFELTVTDEHGASDTDRVDIDVKGGPAFVEPTPGETLELPAGAVVEFGVKAVDSDQNEVPVEVVDKPDGAEYDQQTGQMVWDTQLRATAKTVSFEFLATDADLAATTTVSVELIPRQQAGSLVCSNGLCYNDCSGQKTCADEDAVCVDSTRCESAPCEEVSCSSGQRCLRGECLTACETGADCDGDATQCLNGTCVERRCETDDECSGSMQCAEDGRCLQQPSTKGGCGGCSTTSTDRPPVGWSLLVLLFTLGWVRIRWTTASA